MTADITGLYKKAQIPVPPVNPFLNAQVAGSVRRAFRARRHSFIVSERQVGALISAGKLGQLFPAKQHRRDVEQRQADRGGRPRTWIVWERGKRELRGVRVHSGGCGGGS